MIKKILRRICRTRRTRDMARLRIELLELRGNTVKGLTVRGSSGASVRYPLIDMSNPFEVDELERRLQLIKILSSRA